MTRNYNGDSLKQSISTSLQSGAKPKDVLKAVKKQFPNAKSKELALAAFSLMIEVSDSNQDAASALQEVGLSARKGS
ncbi:MAG: hypothetical protein H6873_00250 [Hyphomicrobiaceae bacterium]|nr:hypothetical protein [Hyphomicrobiaceae bacterium]